MNNHVSSNTPANRPTSTSSNKPASSPFIPPSRKVLSPGEWVRVVSGSDAPFGFDRMPTVFG
ncbi:hypothetical protein EON83_00640 [bacterium]|nr:MAG: hypothetical protein EON83_00640 [bacterium]